MNAKNPKSIKELFKSGGRRLTALRAVSEARSVALEHVCAALPSLLADKIVSAGIDRGQLTVGVAGAPWAARLRYSTDLLRTQVSATLDVDIQRVRIKVVSPRA